MDFYAQIYIPELANASAADPPAQQWGRAGKEEAATLKKTNPREFQPAPHPFPHLQGLRPASLPQTLGEEGDQNQEHPSPRPQVCSAPLSGLRPGFVLPAPGWSPPGTGE